MKQWFMLLIVATSMSLCAKGLIHLERTMNGYSLPFSLPSWSVEQVDTLGYVTENHDASPLYSQISTPLFEGFVTEEVGKPELPVLNFIMVIADKDKPPQFEVTDVIQETVSLKSHVYPAQIPWPKSQPIEERPFSIDKQYYSSQGQKGSLIQVVDIFQIRDVPCARIHVFPYAYDPVTKTLNVIKKATISIKTEIRKNGPLDSKSFEEMISTLAENYSDFYAPITHQAKENYLIITADKYAEALSTFKTFREDKFNVKLVTYTQAGGSNTGLVSFLQKEYENAESKPSFALIVGSHTDIPGFKAKAPSDRPFSSLSTTTYTPKIHVGRMAISNQTDLQNIIKKTMAMEQGLLKGTIKKQAVFIGGVDKGNGKIAEGTHNYVIDTYLSKSGWESKKLFCNTDKALKKTDWSAAVNNNVIYNFYSAHGSTSAWAIGGTFGTITLTDFKALTNTTAYPHSAAFACYTGNYQLAAGCVSAQAVNAPNGIVTCIASSITSTWGPDDKFERVLFDALYKTKVKEIGTAYDAGAVGSANQTYLQQYNFFGDPGLYGAFNDAPTENQTVNQQQTQNLVSIYQSVQGHVVTLNIGQAPTIYDISLFSMSGKTLFKTTESFAHAGSYSLRIPQAGIARGLYILSLQNQQHRIEKKIILNSR